VKITADTNLLLRAIVKDDEAQSRIAQNELDAAEAVIVPVVILCEMVWVLRRGYRLDKREIADILDALINSVEIETDRPLAEAGLDWLKAGGDFADGVIAMQGVRQGSGAFVTFDRTAGEIARQKGISVRLLE
jgi:predicted nucleic-acid-binding protein